MLRRARNRFKFIVERMLLRGAHYRLFVIAILLVFIAVASGLLVMQLTGGFAAPDEAIWWAFLRLTDPGYLGDDEGFVRRSVATFVTVSGYVLFMGALIAIMSQWLTQTMRRLESGLTPIAQSDHVLVLGWTNRTAPIIEELLSSSEERLNRFLRRHGARRLNIAVLAEEVNAERVQELRDHLGPLWDSRRIVFRTGTSLDIDHLRRVDFANAAAVILPGSNCDSTTTADARTIKTLFSISRHVNQQNTRHVPLLVAEIFDARKVMVGVRAYGSAVEIIGSDLFISRLIVQALRHPGLSVVFNELLSSNSSNQVYVRSGDALSGHRLQSLVTAFPNAVLLGALRPEAEGGYQPLLNPSPDILVEEGDRLIFVSRSFADTTAIEHFEPQPLVCPITLHQKPRPTQRRLLMLGWSQRAPSLINEFDRYVDEQFEIDVFADVSIDERRRLLDRHEVTTRRVCIQHLEGDCTVPHELARLNPQAYDGIVLLGSDWLDSPTESDARTTLGHLLLRELIGDGGPPLLIELMNAENAELFSNFSSEILVSPHIVSHMLAQVALRRELRAVFDELFGPDGVEICFCKSSKYDLKGPISFGQVQSVVQTHKQTALGLRLGRETYLNPNKEQIWDLGDDSEIIVLTTYTAEKRQEVVAYSEEE